ncbi:hypothetical protein DPEC_G00138860, partial [Dallia pectoralis]
RGRELHLDRASELPGLNGSYSCPCPKSSWLYCRLSRCLMNPSAASITSPLPAEEITALLTCCRRNVSPIKHRPQGMA